MQTVHFSNFNRGRFASLLKIVLGDTSIRKMAIQTGVDKDYLDRLTKGYICEIPNEEFLRLLASDMTNSVSFEDLKAVVNGERDSLDKQSYKYCLSTSGDYDIDAFVVETEEELSWGDILMFDGKEYIVEQFFSINGRGEMEVLVSEVEKRVKCKKLGIVTYTEREDDDILEVFTPVSD